MTRVVDTTRTATIHISMEEIKWEKMVYDDYTFSTLLLFLTPIFNVTHKFGWYKEWMDVFIIYPIIFSHLT